MSLPSDTNRQLANLVRFGEITAVDLAHKPPLVRVSVDEGVDSDWMPYSQPCVGDFSIWAPPTVGTHGIIFAEGGENEVCRFAPVHNNEANTPAGLGADDFQITFKNGDFFKHNSQTGDLEIKLSGKLIINSDHSQFNGKVVSNTEVTAVGINLTTHTHTGIVPGPAKTGKPS